MHIKLLSITILLVGLISCTENKSAAEKQAEALQDPKSVRKTKPDLLATVPFINVPVVDSTNFDNFNGENKLSNKVVSKLKLKNIDSNYDNFHARYRIALSTPVDMIAITFAAENEMKTFLITYQKEDYKIIDKVIISYDEIAEGAFQSVGKITKNEVIVTNYNYMDEEPKIETKRYQINKSGNFTTR